MCLPTGLVPLIDTVSETVKQSLLRFVENELESSAGVHSGGLVSRLSGGLESSLAEAAQVAPKGFLAQFDSEAEQVERDGVS